MSHGRARRGSVLVITTVAMTGVMVLVTAGADVSRLMTAKNELQTAADAAALAVADRLMEAPTSAHLAAAIARENAVTGSSAVRVDSVRLGQWDPAQRRFVPTSDPWLADAATVVVSTPVRYVFGRMLGAEARTVKVRATAWLAPVNETWCAKPWFLSAEDVLELLGKRGGSWEDITYSDARQLRDTTKGKKWTTLQEKGKGGFKGHAISLPAYEAGGDGSNSGARYRESIPECHRLEVGWHVSPIPGEKVGPTRQGLEQLCKPLAEGVCYNGRGGVGVPVAIPVFDPAQSAGSDRYRVKGIIGFMLTGMEEKGNNAGDIYGYLIGLQGSGGVASGPSAITQPKLVR